VADRAGWQQAVQADLRALSRELDVPPPADLTETVRQRLAGRAGRRPARRAGLPRRWRPAWRVALVAVVAVAALLITAIATPQGRAAITQVLRFAGIELRPGPAPARPAGSSAALPGQRQLPLPAARRRVSFPILVPAALGRPGAVLVSDRGRVATLVYHRTRYGELRLDEFAGHLDPVFFQKFVHFGDMTGVRVNGAGGLWVKGPHVIVYLTRDGREAAASARLTTGNTLIWGTRRVALRLEGGVGEHAALAIASSAS
jgi:hypothetical protein